MNQEKVPSSRKIASPESHNRSLEHSIKSLEDEIELTIYNYENILQSEKKNSTERSEFLLYLLQSLRVRHLDQIQTMAAQISSAQGERESAHAMQKQMENIGEGLDQIIEQSHQLKAQNQQLTRQLEEQNAKERDLDEEIRSAEQELNECRLKLDGWQRKKIKWNRHKKELVEMIEDAEKAVVTTVAMSESNSSVEAAEPNPKICQQTGVDKEECHHCEATHIQKLCIKYNRDTRDDRRSAN